MKPIVKVGIGVAVIGGLAAAVVVGGTHEAAAPAVNYVSIHGQTTSQGALAGKVVLVNFWATSCSGCVSEMPKLVDTYDRLHKQGFETIAVAMSYDDPSYVANFTDSRKLPFFVALDTDGSIAHRFGDVTMTPTSFLIDKHGRIVRRYLGEPDFNQLDALIRQQLAAS